MVFFFQNLVHHADVVELVDTLDSGSSAREGMKVQVLSSALKNPVVRYRVFRFCVILSGREGSSDIPFYNVTPDSVPGPPYTVPFCVTLNGVKGPVTFLFTSIET